MGIGVLDIIDVDPSANSKLANVSSRAFDGTTKMSMEFTINGPDAKKLLIRGIGPETSLAGALQNPTLELRDGANKLLVFNNNWKDTQQSDIEGTGAPPTDDRESAIVATLAPGTYTATLDGACNTTGIALLEIYDLGMNAPTAVPPSSSAPTCLKDNLGRISTRGQIQTGDITLLSDLIVTGSEAKRVLLRLLGPSVGEGGIADPILEFHDSQGTLVGSNDNWKVNDKTHQSQEEAIIATGEAPSQDAESAMLVTLTPGSYVGIGRGKNNTTGVGVLDVIDVDPSANSKVANVTTRAFNGTTKIPMEFTVNGPDAKKVLIRALGPEISLAGTLQNPTLELRDSDNKLLVFNDDWKDTQQSDIQGTGIPPTDDRESAIVATLAPGSYTATLAGTCNTTGVAVLEIYDFGVNTPAALPPSSSPPSCPIPTPPTVQLTTTDNGGTTPPNGTELPDGQTFTLSAIATDDKGVDSVAFVIDGSVIGRTSASPYHLQTSLTVPGNHTLMARATDVDGATTDSNSVTITILPPSGTTYTFQGIAGSPWTTASNWSPEGVPGATDVAQVNSGRTVSIAGANITVASLTIAGGGNVTGNGTLTVTESLNFSGGVVTDAHIIIPTGGLFVMSGAGTKGFNGATIDSAGVTTCIGAGAITGNTTTAFNNTGIFAIQSPSSGPATTATFGQVVNGGFVQIKGKLSAKSYTQSSGELDLNAYLDDGTKGPLTLAVIEANPIQLNGGILTGSGTFLGNLVNNGGTIVPGHSAGVISVQGNYTQGAKATLAFEIAGTQPGEFDQLTVSGKATLNGTLSIRTIDSFTPDVSSNFRPLQFATVSGDFAKTSGNADAVVTPTGVDVKVTAANPPAPQAQNISTRLNVQSGENVLIAGFIITGPAGSNKKVAVRGVGPSLAKAGVANPLLDPLIELHESSGAVLTNDNWKQASNAGQVPTVLHPKDDREPVLIVTLPAGKHTAIVKGAHGEAGVGLAEVYDLDQPSSVHLANISTRGLVESGENVLIGGFIIGGVDPAKVLVRAIGPSLSKGGVKAPLQDPLLEVHDKNGATISNDDWTNTQEAAIKATTIPPSDFRESAVLATLTPGPYTAIVRGKNDTSGVASVEIYMLK